MGRILAMSFCSFVAMGCRLDHHYVYVPSPWEARDWAAQWQLPLEDVWFAAPDGTKLHGWWVPAADSPGVLLWCHGNAGNITHRLENVAELHRRGLSVLIFDYRGYGQSQGVPSEHGLYQDAMAAYDALTTQRHIPPEQIVVFGRSLGAAVGGEVARSRRVAGLILETPFPSVAAMVRAHYGPLPLHWLLAARYDLVTCLRQVHVPVLVLHGDRDTIVPVELGRAVYAAANTPKTFYLIRGADHNDTYVVGGEPYFQCLLSFLRDVTSPAASRAP